tara:strand:- start:4562 stop:5998 length:1437 start_codon:yes stop_codon:yes gene_type:complete
MSQKAKSSLRSRYKISFVLVILLLIIYVILRAYYLSFTHDESISFKIILGDSNFVYTANNHYLNTLLMSISNSLFGDNELALRLPNVLALILYSLGGFLILKTSKLVWTVILCFSVLFLNPFLLEFFALARGYGLSIGFMFMSLFFLLKPDINSSNNSRINNNFILSSIFSSLAVYANLGMINFSICVLAIFILKYYFLVQSKISLNKSTHLVFWSILIIHLIPILIAVNKLLLLKGAGELYFGAPSFMLGFNQLLSSSNYTHYSNTSILLIVNLFMAISFIIGIVFTILKKRFNSPLFYLLLLIFILILGLHIENYLFAANFPIVRTALFYIPLVGLYLYYLISEIYEVYPKKKMVYTLICICISTPLLINFLSSINLSRTKSWDYDAHTKEAMILVKEITLNQNSNSTISNHWILEPAINYYIHTLDIKLNKADREGVKNTSDFIYLLNDNPEIANYNLIKNYTDINSSLLMRNQE